MTHSRSGAVARVLHSAQERWGRPARIFRAPGRVNLIGEHTDYNDGFVLPAAIRFDTLAAAAQRPDRTLAVYSENYSEGREFNLDQLPAAPSRHWSDYVVGVAATLQRTGLKLAGADLLIDGDVPLGSGLSSSASLETAVALALLACSGASLDRTQLALLCQRAEREFVGVNVGIMDQFVSAHAAAGSALLLDCRSLEYEFSPIPGEARLVICNTMVHHELAGSAYNQRRAECEAGVRVLARHLPSVRALRDVTMEQLKRFEAELPPVVYRRCRHVIGENERVLEASQSLRNTDLENFGRLMYASHRSLRDDYEVSSPELDLMVELASAEADVYGARMTGGGFGGCTVNLVRQSGVENFQVQIADRYRQRTGKDPAIYITDAADGAAEITDAATGARQTSATDPSD